MPLCRVRQVVEAATLRLEEHYEREVRLSETQARVICTWIGANAGVWMDLKKGQANPLVEAVQHIDFLGGPPEPDELDEIRGEKVADDWHDDPRLSPQAADPSTGQEAANPAGSLEAFVSAFGGQVTTAEVNGSGS